MVRAMDDFVDAERPDEEDREENDDDEEEEV